ncbi:MAG: HPP family protein [Candidatus Kapaibacterium sp.]|nr:MAG: HPP family protein [Candidatus Kapabacteria bacterium]
MNFFTKLKSDGAQLPPSPPLKSLMLAGVGSFLAISAIVFVNTILHETLAVSGFLASFGASCLLVFGFPDAPFAQPRNVVAGHFTGSCIGLVCMAMFGNHWWSLAFALALTVVVMMSARIVHPPAASNPLIISLAQPSWTFLFFPTLTGAVVLIAIALLYNNLTREAKYPKYW